MTTRPITEDFITTTEQVTVTYKTDKKCWRLTENYETNYKRLKWL